MSFRPPHFAHETMGVTRQRPVLRRPSAALATARAPENRRRAAAVQDAPAPSPAVHGPDVHPLLENEASHEARFGGPARTLLFSFFHFLLFLLLTVGVARAHGPYDSSARLIFLEDSLELTATLGIEGAKQVLLNAGWSEADAASALMSRGPATLHELPAELAPRFFEINANGDALKAARLQVISDGLEASFAATYTGSHGGELHVQARYFDGVEAMKPGAFVATDENRNVKGTAMFSRGNAATMVKATPVAVMEQTATAPIAATASDVAAPAEAEPVRGGSGRNRTAWWIGGLILLAAAILVVIGMFRRAR